MHQYAMSEYTCTTAVLHIELDKTSIWYQKEGGRKKYTTRQKKNVQQILTWMKNIKSVSYYVKMLDDLCYLSQM